MEKIEDHYYRVSADFENRDDAERLKAQIENTQSVSPLAMLTGVSADEAIASFASAFASKNQSARPDHIIDFYTMDNDIDIADTIRDQNVREIAVIAALVRRNANNERAIESLRCDLADLRAAQSAADAAGAHPYRSAATQRPALRPPPYVPLPGPPACFGAAPSCPVVASEAPSTHSSALGVLRRVYGALRGRIADACMALVPILVGVGVYIIGSASGADTIGVVLGMGVTAAVSVPALTWWRT
jgi:hypothetical protein